MAVRYGSHFCSAAGSDDTKGVTSWWNGFIEFGKAVSLRSLDESEYTSVDMFVNITHINDLSVTRREINDAHVTMLSSSLLEHHFDYECAMIGVSLTARDMVPVETQTTS